MHLRFIHVFSWLDSSLFYSWVVHWMAVPQFVYTFVYVRTSWLLLFLAILNKAAINSFMCWLVCGYRFQIIKHSGMHGVPVVAQQKRIWLGTMRLRVQSLAPLSGLRIWRSVNCGVDHRNGSDLAWLWLWHRSAAVALIRPLAWEAPHAPGEALKSKKINKSLNTQECNCWILW